MIFFCKGSMFERGLLSMDHIFHMPIVHPDPVTIFSLNFCLDRAVRGNPNFRIKSIDIWSILSFVQNSSQSCSSWTPLHWLVETWCVRFRCQKPITVMRSPSVPVPVSPVTEFGTAPEEMWVLSTTPTNPPPLTTHPLLSPPNSPPPKTLCLPWLGRSALWPTLWPRSSCGVCG